MIRDPWAACAAHALAATLLRAGLVAIAVIVATSCAIGLAGVVQDACGEVCEP